MAEDIVKISVSGSRVVVSGLDKMGTVLPTSLVRGMGKIGTVLKHRMSAHLASGATLGRRTGSAAASVVAKVGKDKRGIVALLVFPRVSYAWMNAYGFPRTLLRGVGGVRTAMNTKTGETRVLGYRKKKRKREMEYKEGGYDRFHVLQPRPFAPLVLSASEGFVNDGLNRAVNDATKEAGLGS